MANVNNGSGYEYGLPPKVNYPVYGDDTTPSPSDINITASASVDETTGMPSAEVEKTQDGDNVNFAFKFAGLKGEKGADGAQGPQGEKGDTGATGATGPDYNAVVSIAITNENGVYTVKNTMHDGTEHDVGTIEVPESDAGIVEVKDTVVENNTSGYDFHTITETQNDGTENEVGKFYIAQVQQLQPAFAIEKNGTKFVDPQTVNQGGTYKTTILDKQVDGVYMSGTNIEADIPSTFPDDGIAIVIACDRSSSTAIFPVTKSLLKKIGTTYLDNNGNTHTINSIELGCNTNTVSGYTNATCSLMITATNIGFYTTIFSSAINIHPNSFTYGFI